MRRTNAGVRMAVERMPLRMPPSMVVLGVIRGYKTRTGQYTVHEVKAESMMKQRRRARAGARAKRRGAGAAEPSRSLRLRHVSLLAPELGVHVVLAHLVGAKLAMPAVTLRAVLGGAKPAKLRVITPVVAL